MKRKPVKSLKYWCFESIGPTLTKHIRKVVSKSASAKCFGLLHGEIDVNPEDVIDQQIKLLKTHIWSHVIWYDFCEFFKIVTRSVEDAILITKKSWKPSINIEHFRQEMDHIVLFTDLAIQPDMLKLDFGEIPPCIRSSLVANLGSFKKLSTLILRPYDNKSGNWLFKSVLQDLIKGFRGLQCLKEFSLKHDCNNRILEALASSCWYTLKILDMEYSKQINNESVDYILSCQNLIELNVFKTSINDEGKGRLIHHLPNLCHLPRGDFLCDALAWIEEDEDEEEQIFKIREFFPSMKYYFHEAWQLEMVAQCCPFIEKMLFIFHESCVEDYLVLTPFENLTDLELFGGNFYTDKICDLIQIKGTKLKKLSLLSIKEMDFKAFALITIHGKMMTHLNINNCDLVDYHSSGDPNSDDEYDRRQSYLNMAKEAYEIVEPFESLEHISITSHASSLYLVFILGRAKRLKSIEIGPNNGLNDESMIKILLQNPLLDLEEFHCERNVHFTKATVHLLVNNCINLKCLSDMQSWSSLDPNDLSHFREHIRQCNYNMDTRSHTKMRKYLELRDFERQTYHNLVTGPALERIRMAQAQLHQ